MAGQSPAPAHNNAAPRPLYDTEPPALYVKPDSTLLTGGRPLFVPDYMGRIDYTVQLAVRVSRLGKTIPERFAHRYYDAVTLALDLTARDMLERLAARGLPQDMGRCFDCAVVLGEWVPTDEATDLTLRLASDGETVQRAVEAGALARADALIACASRYLTLKTGDILLTGAQAAPLAATPEHHIEGYLGDRRVMDFNCK